jgi:hypothetical protein
MLNLFFNWIMSLDKVSKSVFSASDVHVYSIFNWIFIYRIIWLCLRWWQIKKFEFCYAWPNFDWIILPARYSLLPAAQLECVSSVQSKCVSSVQLECMSSVQLECMSSVQSECMSSVQSECVSSVQLECMSSVQSEYVLSVQSECVFSIIAHFETVF